MHGNRRANPAINHTAEPSAISPLLAIGIPTDLTFSSMVLTLSFKSEIFSEGHTEGGVLKVSAEGSRAPQPLIADFGIAKDTSLELDDATPAPGPGVAHTLEATQCGRGAIVSVRGASFMPQDCALHFRWILPFDVPIYFPIHCYPPPKSPSSLPPPPPKSRGRALAVVEGPPAAAGYVAPEVLLGAPHSFASDVWALGMLPGPRADLTPRAQNHFCPPPQQQAPICARAE